MSKHVQYYNRYISTACLSLENYIENKIRLTKLFKCSNRVWWLKESYEYLYSNDRKYNIIMYKTFERRALVSHTCLGI